MMRIVLLLCALFSLQTFYGQVSPNPFGKNKWEITLYSGAGYNDAFHRIDEIDRKGLIKILQEQEQPKIGFAGGLRFHHRISQKFSLAFGLGYIDKGNQYIGPIIVIPSLTLTIDSNGTINSIHYGDGYVRYKYQYVEISVLAYYNFFQDKIALYGFLGINTSAIVRYAERLKITEANGNIYKSKISLTGFTLDKMSRDFNTINYDLMTGLSFEYNYSSNISILLEPFFRQSINPIYNVTSKKYAYSFGLLMGLNINIE